MFKNIALFGLFVILIGCGGRYGKGYDGWDENYVDAGTGFTMWLPKKMKERHYGSSIVDEYAETCGRSSVLDVNLLPDAEDVSKEDADGIRTYAFAGRYYADGGSDMTCDGKRFNRTIKHDYFFNIMINQKGQVLDCKYLYWRETMYSPISEEPFRLPIIIIQ